MNEQEFDKNIGDKLKLQKEFYPSNNQWAKMNNLLGNNKSNNRLLFLPWLFTGLSLLGGSFYVSHLMGKINELKKTNESSVVNNINGLKSYVHMDTCFSEISIVKRNIIIKNIYKTNVINNGSFESSFANAQDVRPQNNYGTEKDGLKYTGQANNDPNKLKDPVTKPSSHSSTMDKGSSETTLNSDLDKHTINSNKSNSKNDTVNKSLNEYKTGMDNLTFKSSPDSLEKIEKDHLITVNKKSKAKPFKISGYEAGILAGYAESYTNNVIKQYGYITGLQANIIFKNQVSVVGNFDYINLTFEHDSYDGTDLPQINPPGPDDVLKDITVIKPYFNYYLGLNYSPFNWMLRPYFGLGLSGLMRLEPTNNYQFENTKTKEETNTINNTYSKVNEFPNYNLRLGLEYPIYYPLIWKLEGTYTLNSNLNYKYQPLYNIKTGVAIRF